MPRVRSHYRKINGRRVLVRAYKKKYKMIKRKYKKSIKKWRGRR